MLVTSSFVNGGVVGFVGIQPLSCTKRKNARNPSSFLHAAIFFWAIYTNDKAHLTEQLSRDVFHQSALELSRELRPRENHLQHSSAQSQAHQHTISECIALLLRRSTATIDPDFAKDVEAAVESHREPLSPPEWD